MFRKPIRETVAAFPAQESQLAGLRKTVEEICRQANLSPRDINNMVLAIEEGATNIIRHAYLLSEGEIRLKVAVFKHFIVFSLYDQGKSFQPPDKARLDLKKMSETGRKGGLGFYLINKVMDRVEYFSLEGENELRMTKFITDRGERDLQWSGGFSLRMKFSAGTLLIILILLAGAYYYVNSRTTGYIYSQLDKTVEALSNTIASQAYGYIINHRSDAEFDELVVSYQRANDILTSVVIVGTDGQVLADSREPGRLRTQYDPARFARFVRAGQSARFEVETVSPTIIRRIDHGGSNQGMVIMQYSTVTVAEQLTRARRIILIITIAGLLIGIVGIYLLSNYFVRPIGRIVSRVRKFSQGDLDSQLPLEGAGEFYEISKALNELIMRIRRDRKNIVEREILQKEMQLAEQIQLALIPHHLPTIRGFGVGTIYRAARMVGGDLFDVVKIDEETFGVVVADVSGKGVPGSLVMAMVRMALRLEAKGNRSARDIVLRLNDHIADDIKRGMFVTILLAVIDTRTRIVNFASAGHNPVIHYRGRDGQAVFINAKGMPVGIETDRAAFAAGLEEATISLEPNDYLVIYTDGITEGRGNQQRAYGTDRVVDIIRESREHSAADVAAAIEKDIVRFIGKQDQHDDITMVILKNCPASAEPSEGGADATAGDIGRRTDIVSVIIDPPSDRKPEI